MEVNKVEFNGLVVLDLTNDTVTAGDLKSGVKAHDKSGAIVTGTFASETKTATPKTSDQTVSPSSGKYLSGVTVKGVSVPAAANILTGSNVSSNGTTLVSGNMPNNGAVTPSGLNCGSSYTIPAGYHNGSGKVTANSLASQTKVDTGKTGISPGVVKSGYQGWVDGQKITGTNTQNADTRSDTVTESDVLLGKTFHNSSGQSKTGSMLKVPSLELNIDSTSYINNSPVNAYVENISYGIKSTEANKIVASNIKKGVTILGVTGTVNEGVNVSDTTATKYGVLSGLKFHKSDGTLETGVMPDNSNYFENIEAVPGTVVIPDGFHSNSRIYIEEHPLAKAIIWTNPKPNSSFAAQVINFGMSYTGRAGYIIVFKHIASNDTYTLSEWFFPIKEDGTAFNRRVTCGWINGAPSTANRYVHSYHNQIEFEVGRNNTTNNNSYCIPVEISVLR